MNMLEIVNMVDSKDMKNMQKTFVLVKLIQDTKTLQDEQGE